MTSHVLTAKLQASVSEYSGEATKDSSLADNASRQSRVLEVLRSQYQADQQIKFLHLQAEAESLLQQLRVMKQQKQPDSTL
jgi:hypothetical protein